MTRARPRPTAVPSNLRLVPPGTDLLPRLFGLWVHLLERTGGAARLAALPVPVAPAARPLAALLAGAAAVLLLQAALASGRDVAVRAFRAAALLAALALPLAALRLVPASRGPAIGGAALLLVAFSSIAHRALASRRAEGTASRLLARARLLLEGTGLALSALSLGLLLAGRALPLRLAFWSLFLLRLSIADLIDPSRLAARTGLAGSAARDARSALGKVRRPPRPLRRLRRALAAAAKGSLLLLWLALPLAAALAPGEVAAGAWPRWALQLRWYPPLALALTALLLLGQAGRSFRGGRPLDAARGAAVGVGTAAWLALAYRDGAFAAWRSALPGLVLAEAVAGFLLGAAARGRAR